MARKRKTRLDYFPFDVDFFEDEKIVCIAGEFGIKGEITAIRLLCAVYRNGYFILWSEQLKMKMLRQMPGVSSELFDQILNRLVRWGFFDANLFDSVKVLTSVGIQRRYFEAVKFRQIDDDLPYLLIHDELKNYAKKNISQGLMGISQTKTPVSQGLIPQIKLNKKENKFSSPPTPQGVVGAVDVGAKKSEIIQKFFSKQIALESFCMHNNTDPEDLRRLIDEIFAEWELSNEQDISEKHLVNTLRIKLKIKRNETDRPLKGDRFSERRGTDPDVPGREDYSDTL